MNKIFFGLFTFTLGLLIGLFFNNLIWDIAPETSDLLKGTVLILSVVVFYFIWRLSENISKKNEAKRNNPE